LTAARNVAISARLTGRSGQQRGGSVPQPAVMPAAAMALMPAVWAPRSSTSVNPAGRPGSRLKVWVRNVAISARLTGRSGQ